MIPENLQNRNVRRFKGFTPQQVAQLLNSKGLKPNSREAAEYLGAMAERAEEILQKTKPMKAYQGGGVGGFDDRSRKLFDAAVRRTAGTDPKSPEVQRYLDNVIETRGRPTMVYPTTADPLQGYQEGGAVDNLEDMPMEGGDVGFPKPGVGNQTVIDDGPANKYKIGNPGDFPVRVGLPTDPGPIDFPPPNFESQPDPMPKVTDRMNIQRDPLSDPTTSPDQGADQQLQLDQAQNNLAAEQEKLNKLQQQLANTPLDDEAAREELKTQIEQQKPNITSAESALASASKQFQTVAVPTAAEAVGSAVTRPEDLLTKQPVDLIREESDQLIDPYGIEGVGQVTGDIDPTVTTGTADQADDVVADDAAQVDTAKTADAVAGVEPEERLGTIAEDAIVEAQEIATEDLNIRDVEAAQGTGQQIDSTSKRTLQQGELISGAANAEQAAKFTEGVEAATGAPSTAATVQGQLTDLMSDFEGNVPPPWAAGAMRQATAIMAKRGLAASSMAGQAIVQAAMESALPIAMQDAQTVASFEAQNLSNRQQRAMLAAEQRAQFMGMEFDQAFQARVQNASKISDIANLNFTAEQQIALENAKLAQTMDLANLDNRQAVVMAQAANIAQADMVNLENRQQAAVQNAQSFLQMDMKNLDIQQQNDMFKTQSVMQSIFTDAAAENAAKQFNATSENQTNQFFANLQSQTNQFNVSQANSMEQYNVGQTNALEQFKQQVKNQREQFNATNGLVIAQANAQWRQQLSTINNAALNDANRQNALQANGLTQKGLDEIWQKERDLMAYAFATAESAAERRNKLLLNELDAEGRSDSAFSSALGTLGGAIINGIFGLF
tara:strand:+ start:10 stop:2526 length:2517 start_codon:yes stop_codon:yes gene_type:complete